MAAHAAFHFRHPSCQAVLLVVKGSSPVPAHPASAGQARDCQLDLTSNLGHQDAWREAEPSYFSVSHRMSDEHL